MRRIEHIDNPNAPKANSLIPAASAIVTSDENRILLIRRRDNDLWSIPGGTMEIGESISQTVVREVEEETGLEVEPLYIVGIYSNPRHVVEYSNGEVRQQFSICFACKVLGGAIKTSDESTEVRFFTQNEMGKPPMTSSIRRRIDDYLTPSPRPVFD
jgi:ADP-ribose pyrophosphatase YjhB (NUDIX family)